MKVDRPVLLPENTLNEDQGPSFKRTQTSTPLPHSSTTAESERFDGVASEEDMEGFEEDMEGFEEDRKGFEEGRKGFEEGRKRFEEGRKRFEEGKKGFNKNMKGFKENMKGFKEDMEGSSAEPERLDGRAVEEHMEGLSFQFRNTTFAGGARVFCSR